MGNTSSSQPVPKAQRDPNLTDQPQQSHNTLATAQTGTYPQIILFGDSITQNATLTLQPRLQALYVRRADVINRGFSGYTTALALQSLPYFLPLGPSLPSSNKPSVRLVTIFFGANDAALPQHAQHVPLPIYTASLERLIKYAPFQQHNTKVILITPAPVDEWQLEQPPSRTAINTRRYARAARQVARNFNIPCVDLWTVFATLCGYRDAPDQESPDSTQTSTRNKQEPKTSDDQPPISSLTTKPDDTTNTNTNQHADTEPPLPGSLSAPRNQTLATLLKDGLHFTPLGYDVLYTQLLAVIQTELPEYLPENMPFIFEPWRDILGVPKKENPDTNLETSETVTAARDPVPTLSRANHRGTGRAWSAGWVGGLRDGELMDTGGVVRKITQLGGNN